MSRQMLLLDVVASGIRQQVSLRACNENKDFQHQSSPEMPSCLYRHRLDSTHHVDDSLWLG